MSSKSIKHRPPKRRAVQKRRHHTRVQGYLERRTYAMFIAHMDKLGIGESEHVNNIVNSHYDNMSLADQRSLREHYEKMKKAS